MLNYTPSFVTERGLFRNRAYAPKDAEMEDFEENARMGKILRTAVQHNGANVGVYAELLRNGMIRSGDAIRFV